MTTKNRAILAACLATLAAAGNLQAANIAFVSFHSSQNDAPSAAAGAVAGFGAQAPDAGYTQLLRAAGHNVTRIQNTATPNVAQLNGFDLVIISRSVPSGDFDADAETAAWNGVTAPTMILGGYILRNNRLGYTTGTTMPDTIGNVTLSIANPSHPIFDGVTLAPDNTVVYGEAVVVNGITQLGISINANPVAGGGTVLASVTGNGTAGANGFMVIGEWQAGAQMATAPADTLGGHRLVFLTGTREVAPATSETAGVMDLTPAGEQMFLNAVDYMAVPEPSTYALLGFGAAAMLFGMRRKSK